MKDRLPLHEKLERLTDEELIDKYNVLAEGTIVGTQFYRDEIVRRRQERQNSRIEGMTRTMQCLTVVMAIFTFVNVVLVAFSILFH